MGRKGRALLIASLGGVAALIAHILDPHGTADDLAILAAGVTLGELFVLRLEDRSSVPLSFAFMIVLARSFNVGEYALVVIAAELVAFFLCPRGNDPGKRDEILCARLLVAAATFGVYQAVWTAFGRNETEAAVIVSLAAAAAAQFVTEMSLRTIMKRGKSLTNRGRLAWLAVSSSGMLMAIGYGGIEGKGDLKIAGSLLLATPLFAAWYAFERLDAATLAYRQTIESLAMAPELGGLAPNGHAERVASLVASMGKRLGLPESDLNDLQMAALLHHLGQVTLDDPEVAGRPDQHHVAAITSSMLSEIEPLAGAGEIIAGDCDDPRRRLAVQVLRAASEFDELTVVDGSKPAAALESLRTAPSYVYDDRVLNALERALGDTSSAVG